MIGHDVRSHVAGPARSARHRSDGDRRTGPALGAALVAMGLVAGLIYTFSAAVMPNLAGAADLAHVRDTFEGPWVAANIVRTLLSTAAVAALARALFLHGRSKADR